nr:NFACT RNA binding domain-containing protein [Caloramator sp. E03]
MDSIYTLVKNNIQNDYLTTKFAVGSDIWMHVKNIPGSHVIIKSKNGNVSDTALLEGALLAAFFSKAKHSSNVPVDYTEKKNVKKPSGAKPGMVVYFTNKTIYVTPEESKIKKINISIIIGSMSIVGVGILFKCLPLLIFKKF